MDDFCTGRTLWMEEDIWSENGRVEVTEEDVLPFSMLAVGK
jgi:hypothetical protein